MRDDERTHKLLYKAGLERTYGLVTDPIEDVVACVLGFDSNQIYKGSDGRKWEEGEIVYRIVSRNFIHSDNWPDGKTCVENLISLKERLRSASPIDDILAGLGD